MNIRCLLFLFISFIISSSILFCNKDCGSDNSGSKIIFSNMNYNIPVIGSVIPDYEMNAFHKGKIKKLKFSDFKNKWLVLFFYPADFTFVCPTELKELAELYEEFKKAGAEILSISTDSAFVHQAWHKHNESVNKVKYPMLSDRSANLSKAMGVYNKEDGNSRRGTFIISPERKIVAYEVHHDSIGRSSEELLRKLWAAVAVGDSHGGLCPAGWKPGQEMLETK